MILINNSPEKINYLQTDKLKILDYGNISRNSNTDVHVTLESENPLKFEKYSVCACTKVYTEEVEGKLNLRITYDSKIKGVFAKTIQYYYKEAGEPKIEQIQIKGTVR